MVPRTDPWRAPLELDDRLMFAQLMKLLGNSKRRKRFTMTLRPNGDPSSLLYITTLSPLLLSGALYRDPEVVNLAPTNDPKHVNVTPELVIMTRRPVLRSWAPCQPLTYFMAIPTPVCNSLVQVWSPGWITVWDSSVNIVLRSNSRHYPDRIQDTVTNVAVGKIATGPPKYLPSWWAMKVGGCWSPAPEETKELRAAAAWASRQQNLHRKRDACQRRIWTTHVAATCHTQISRCLSVNCRADLWRLAVRERSCRRLLKYIAIESSQMTNEIIQ